MLELSLQTSFTTFCSRGAHYGTSSAAILLAENINSTSLLEIQDNRELKQTDAAAERRRSHSNFLSIIE